MLVNELIASPELGRTSPRVAANTRFNLAAAETAVRDLLLALGLDADDAGLRKTPRRVTKMYLELFAGLNDDPARHLSRTFPEACDEIVLLWDIGFASICEHHLLTFIGRAHVANLPSVSVVGLSKLARTVDEFARRPQVQERLPAQIADALMTHCNAREALVVVESEHFCMKIRGVIKPNSVMVTSAVRGHFNTNAAAGAEAMTILSKRNV